MHVLLLPVLLALAQTGDTLVLKSGLVVKKGVAIDKGDHYVFEFFNGGKSDRIEKDDVVRFIPDPGRELKDPKTKVEATPKVSEPQPKTKTVEPPVAAPAPETRPTPKPDPGADLLAWLAVKWYYPVVGGALGLLWIIVLAVKLGAAPAEPRSIAVPAPAPPVVEKPVAVNAAEQAPPVSRVVEPAVPTVGGGDLDDLPPT